MKYMLGMLVTALLLTKAHCQHQVKSNNEEIHKSSKTKTNRNSLPVAGLEGLYHHTLLDLVGIGRSEVNSALKVLGTIFNFVDIYGRSRYPVMESNYRWFRWVDKNLPLVLNMNMAPVELDPYDIYAYEYDYEFEKKFEDYLDTPYYAKTTSTKNVIWQDFYKKMYTDIIAPLKAQRSGGTSRQDNCLDGMYHGYSSIEVDVLGQTFKYLAENTVTPVYEFIRSLHPDYTRRDPNLAAMPKVDPLYKLSEHLAYFLGLSEGEDTYSFYESRMDAQDRSITCLDSTARVMNAVMPYGPFLTLSNLAAVGVWMMTFWAPFLGF